MHVMNTDDQSQDELYEYCYRPRRTIREVLEEFRSARVPKEYIFDLFPPMRPREFSIASSVKVCFCHFEHAAQFTMLVYYRIETSTASTAMHRHRTI